MRILIRNARLIDGTGTAAQDGAALLIEGDTIVHAGPLAAADAPDPAAAVTLDAGGRTVIPGLVEAHLHLSYNDVKQIADLDLNCPPEYSTLVSAKNAELVLHCGYTAARSAGSVHAVDVALKRAINEGLFPGPRLLAAGRDICATGGMADWNPSYLKLGMEGLALIADGPEQIRAAVRRVDQGRRRRREVLRRRRRAAAAHADRRLHLHAAGGAGAGGRGPHARPHGRGPRAGRALERGGRPGGRRLDRARDLRQRRHAQAHPRRGPHAGAGAALPLLDHRERAALRDHRGDRRAQRAARRDQAGLRHLPPRPRSGHPDVPGRRFRIRLEPARRVRQGHPGVRRRHRLHARWRQSRAPPATAPS